MSALHHLEAQASSTSPYDTLSGEDVLFKVVHSITADEWKVLQLLVTINNLVDEGQKCLDKEAQKLRVKDDGWRPNGKSALRKLLDEAKDENAPKDSLWRELFILAGRYIKPTLIFGLICNSRNYGNRIPKKQTSVGVEAVGVEEKKLTFEEEVKLWPTDAKIILIKKLMDVSLPETIHDYVFIEDYLMKRKRGL